MGPETAETAQKHFFSRQAPSPEKFEALIAGRQEKARQVVELIRPHLPAGGVGTALSIGASFCIIEEEIRKHLCPGATFICTDLDEDALGAIEHPHLSKRVASATDLNLRDGSVELAVAHQVLEHINAYPAALRELARVLAPGGVLYINVPSPWALMPGLKPDGSPPAPKHFARHLRVKLRRDFFANTEAYHTGFGERRLRELLPGFEVIDLRGDRLRQALKSRVARLLASALPRSLLSLLVPTNIWIVRKPAAGVDASGQ
jgi:SAM-dependent methyltransferase